MRMFLRSDCPGRSGFLLAATMLAAVAPLGCGTVDLLANPPGTLLPVTAIYVVPVSFDALSGETFFDHPWPSDLRLENGAPRFAGYPNPRGFALLDVYTASTQGLLDGFSPAASGFLRFTGAIDPASLPATPAEGLDSAAAVQLLDIDPGSPERGQRQRVSLRWQPAEGLYYRPNTLAFMPTVGFPLRPHTRYAMVVTDALRAASGEAVTQQAALAEVVGANPPSGATAAAHAALATAVEAIERAGIVRTSLVHLAVFTTSDPTRELMQVRDAVPSLVSAPVVDPASWAHGKSTASYDEYVGRYGPSPNFQAGALPFKVYGEGGGFVFHDGQPVLQDTFDLRFSLSVPKASACPMPSDGYPIVLYAHGTGGDYQSYRYDGTAAALAQQCLASMGIDQIFHGERPGAPPSGSGSTIGLLFFNFQNPIAARTNGRQAAIDEVQRARLFTESHLVVPPSVSVTQHEVRFDASKLLSFGHSQGGLNGPLFTAVDPSVRGAVFSGSAAQLAIALLEKTLPLPSPAALVQTLLLGLGTDAGHELDLFHPSISLVQSLMDVVDPLHYARLQAIAPRAGFAPKSMYLSEGINPDGTGDHYAPPHGIEAHAIAMGLPPELPMQRAPVELQWGGTPPVKVPPEGLSGNLGGGKASGILAQFAVPPGNDGHFVIFDVDHARQQSSLFLKNLAADPVGRVPP